jgi:hypothetical protein
LTMAETVAGFRIAEIYGRYERHKRLRRSSRSPSYERAWGDPDIAEELMGPEALEEHEARIRDATEAFERLNGRLLVDPARKDGRPLDDARGRQVVTDGLIPKSLRNAIETLCVEDRPISPSQLPYVRWLLAELAVNWNITRRAAEAQQREGRAAPSGPPLHFNKHREGDVAPAAAKKPKLNLDKIYWMQVAKVLRPDLSETELARAYDFQQALKARGIMLAKKGDRPGLRAVPAEPPVELDAVRKRMAKRPVLKGKRTTVDAEP